MDDHSSLETLSKHLSGLTAEVAPKVVAVQSHGAISSGFVWRQGLIVTADEALADEGHIAVTFATGERRPALLAGRDPATDVALLRVEGEMPDAPGFAVAPMSPGALVLAIGADQSAVLAAFGIVARSGPAWRSMRGGEIDARIELDLRLRRQAEGGIVLNAAGKVIGMPVFGPRQRVLVIPAATIERIAGRLATHGRVAKGFIGLGLQTVPVDQGESIAAMVMGVAQGGPGAAAGIHQGDMIVSWQGEAISGVPQLLRRLGAESVGRTVQVGLRRGGQVLEVSLTIGEKP
jgi:S1-C subfamily serine protease